MKTVKADDSIQIAGSKLDELDHKLIICLQANARSTLTDLSQELGLSVPAVRKRLNSLLHENYINLEAFINAMKFDLSVNLILLKIKTEELLNSYIRRYTPCPNVLAITKLTGTYNLCMIVFGESMTDIQSITSKCHITCQIGIEKSEITALHLADMTFNGINWVKIQLIPYQINTICAPCSNDGNVINCGNCQSFLANNCVGCRSTRWYHGKL